jgi:hypothetical protein
MTPRRLTISGLLAAVVAALYLSAQSSVGAGPLPEQLSGKAFWQLSTELSEEDGFFQSDNLLSNEIWLQHVIPDLVKSVPAGRVYLGVGPEQNFTYIAALKPAMVFIIDVRRGNLHLHLMYKALFELSADRAEFVGRLFSRQRPAELTAHSSVLEIFKAYAEVPTSEAVFKENVAAIREHLVRRRGIPLNEADLAGVQNVAYQFHWHGPDITYNSNRGRFRAMPRYVDLMLSTDGAGQNRSFLASDENFQLLKSLHARNLVVPVVGNFGGSKALRAVGKYIRDQGGTVAAFYLSNVEQYLGQTHGMSEAFCKNVATLPLDERSAFIRSTRGGPGGNGFTSGLAGGYRYPGLINELGRIQDETRSCR